MGGHRRSRLYRRFFLPPIPFILVKILRGVRGAGPPAVDAEGGENHPSLTYATRMIPASPVF